MSGQVLVPQLLAALLAVVEGAVADVATARGVTVVYGAVAATQHIEGDVISVGTPRQNNAAVTVEAVVGRFDGSQDSTFDVECDMQVVDGNLDMQVVLDRAGAYLEAIQDAVLADRQLAGLAVDCEVATTQEWDLAVRGGAVVFVGFTIRATTS